MDRVSDLERKLSEYETMSKNYSKVKNENASLIRLLANFVRSEYNIQTSSRRQAAAAAPANVDPLVISPATSLMPCEQQSSYPEAVPGQQLPRFRAAPHHNPPTSYGSQ